MRNTTRQIYWILGYVDLSYLFDRTETAILQRTHSRESVIDQSLKEMQPFILNSDELKLQGKLRQETRQVVRR